jgi:hypothetical protein
MILQVIKGVGSSLIKPLHFINKEAFVGKTLHIILANEK